MNSDFFVSEVSFENVAKVIGFIHVFANGEKCICLFMILFFVFANISSGNDYSWIKLVLKFLLKWWVLLMCLRMVKTATVCGCLCFFLCLSLLFQNCLKYEVLHYFFRKKWGASLFLKNKMKCLIISLENNQFFFWRKNEGLHFFLKKK